MTEMSRVVVNSLMVWLLVAPPVLCRAGVLVECCDDGPAEVATVATDSPCCGDAAAGCGDGESAPQPGPRKCGSCATICSSPAKPADEANVPTLVAAAAPLLHARSESPSAAHNQNPDRSRSRGELPFPPTDIPLLI